MAVAEGTPRVSGSASSGGDLWTRPLFGIELVSGEEAGGRTTRWLHVPARELDLLWPKESHRTVDMRFPDGKLFMAIEYDDRVGYMVRAPRFGRHVVSPDGRTITSVLPRIAPWRWERLFLGQVLPLAAALQGLEVFHASAVAVRDRAIAFVGTSGVGKTSTAAHLVARGADFFTDDVLALEPGPEGVMAHPGPPRLAIDAAEVRRMLPDVRARLGPLLGTFEKQQFAPVPAERPLRLANVYFLQRTPSSGGPIVVEVDEPRRLLGAPFVPHLRSPERLLRHLDVCAAIAGHARNFAVEVPVGCHADEVAAVVHEHVEAVLA
jgi:hypothetical protein